MIYAIIFIITLIGDSIGQTIYKNVGDDTSMNGMPSDFKIFYDRELILEDKVNNCKQEVKSIRETADILQFQLRCINETGTYQERRVANAQYCFIKSSFTWDDGKSKCQSFKSYLLEINSEAEQNWLMDKVLTDKWWTGAMKHPQYNDWVWDHSGDGLTYKNWYPNQPNGGNREECMLSEKGLWHDYPCNSRYKIICERGE